MRPKHARPATKADETPEFVQFWTIWQAVKSEYDGRASARDEFFRLVWWRGAAPQDIVDGAQYYVHNFRAGQLRLKADTWMSRGHYEDDCEKWRAYQARQHERPANVVQMQQPKPARKTAFLELYESGKATG